MGLYIEGIDVGEIKRGAVACINVDDVVFFVSSDKIIPVPDHGDLIDRDALFIKGGRNCGKMFFAELLKNAPVVIPSERNVKVCPLYSDDEVTEYCVEGPCTDEMEGRCPIAERSADERE